MTKKKILIIILFVVIIVGLAWLLYLVFFKKPPPPPIVIPPVEEVIPPRLPVTQEAWERMTVQERIQRGLPPTQWIEEVEVPEVVRPPARIIPQIDDIASGGITWVTPISQWS